MPALRIARPTRSDGCERRTAQGSNSLCDSLLSFQYLDPLFILEKYSTCSHDHLSRGQSAHDPDVTTHHSADLHLAQLRDVSGDRLGDEEDSVLTLSRLNDSR